jgi:3-isopropylmalate/(R)-2-methylmalate dehydratase large subunit
MPQPLTLFQKVWNNHVVVQEPDSPAVLIHRFTTCSRSNIAAGIRRFAPVDLRFAVLIVLIGTMDHSIPTLPPSVPISDELAAKQMCQMEINAQEFGFRLYGKNHPQRGIVHIIGPELGFTQPGMTIVCGDSHTATHGAFGALAFGIGTSEVEHVLATQCLLQRLPRTMEVRIEGKLSTLE